MRQNPRALAMITRSEKTMGVVMKRRSKRQYNKQAITTTILNPNYFFFFLISKICKAPLTEPSAQAHTAMQRVRQCKEKFKQLISTEKRKMEPKKIREKKKKR
jgi:hypothetical protein